MGATEQFTQSGVSVEPTVKAGQVVTARTVTGTYEARRGDVVLIPLPPAALTAIRASPGARGYYDQVRARGVGHRAALRQLGNRLVGVLGSCLRTKTSYDEETAWPTLTKRLGYVC
ncbi:hypothetical protein [Micromonospora sp. NPDC023737]|uniref:hypothetical protein n=1 Tax=unclassified Micromonospora TaxID=2617518 RepID=UPI0033F600DE